MLLIFYCLCKVIFGHMNHSNWLSTGSVIARVINPYPWILKKNNTWDRHRVHFPGSGKMAYAIQNPDKKSERRISYNDIRISHFHIDHFYIGHFYIIHFHIDHLWSHSQCRYAIGHFPSSNFPNNCFHIAQKHIGHFHIVHFYIGHFRLGYFDDRCKTGLQQTPDER